MLRPSLIFALLSYFLSRRQEGDKSDESNFGVYFLAFSNIYMIFKALTSRGHTANFR
jgi:hypothetical protein